MCGIARIMAVVAVAMVAGMGSWAAATGTKYSNQAGVIGKTTFVGQ